MASPYPFMTPAQAAVAALQTQSPKRKMKTVQDRAAESQAKKAVVETIAVREPEYDPFAAGTGYAGSDPEYSPADETPRLRAGTVNPATGEFHENEHITERVHESIKQQVEQDFDETARSLGFENAEAMRESVRRSREAAEAYARDKEAAEEQAMRDAEQEAYCKLFINETLKQVNKALADERAEAEVLQGYLQRYPELFYDMRGAPSEESIRAVVSQTIQVHGREKVRFRDSDLERLYASAARWDIVTARAETVRQAVQMLETGTYPETAGENDCWRRYKAHLANQPKRKGGKKVAVAFLAAYLLGAF